MLESIKKTCEDIFTPTFINLFIYVLVSSLIVFFSIILFFWFLIPDLGYIGKILGFIFIGTLNVAWIFFIFSITTILFIPLSTLVFSLFSDKIIAQIEQKHYFYEPHPLKEGFLRGIFTGLKLLIWTLFLIVFFTPLLSILSVGKYFSIIFWIMINGYIIGKEYFELIAKRRLIEDEILKFRSENFKRLYLGGLLCSIIFSIPIINLIAPLFTTVFSIHEFNKIRLTN
tara:strand:+ start:4 stop:687 length:684 start_codon:yes stop_codon:yes gene_type:complete